MNQMKFPALQLICAVLLLGPASCGSDTSKGTPDTKGQDVAGRPDLGTPDQADDALVPEDALPDLVKETTGPEDLKDLQQPDDVQEVQPQDVDKPDTDEVVEPDVQPEDATDTAEEIVDPAKCGFGDNIAGLLQCAEGPVDVWLKGATVTYVFDKGFFVYDASTKRGMEFYLPTLTFTAPVPGDVLECHVLEFGSFKGQQEVTSVDTCTKTGSADPAETSLELVSLSTAPSEEIESRLVSGLGMTVIQVIGMDVLVAYGTQASVTVRLDAEGPLCVGATFDLLRGVITQYDEIHRIQVFVSASDLLNINTTACGAAPEYDDSNWGFEEAGLNDPPADFQKATSAFTATRDTAQFHAGTASCLLTWTSSTNQDFFQGYYKAVAPDQSVTFSVWVLDEATGGRVRPGLVFYRADKTLVGSALYSPDFTADNVNWLQMTYVQTAPAEAAFVRGLVRMYDDGSSWTGSASVNVDDWSLTVQ